MGSWEEGIWSTRTLCLWRNSLDGKMCTTLMICSYTPAPAGQSSAPTPALEFPVNPSAIQRQVWREPLWRGPPHCQPMQCKWSVVRCPPCQFRSPVTSASFLADISVSSPRKLFVFIIFKKIWIKVSKKKNIFFEKGSTACYQSTSIF